MRTLPEPGCSHRLVGALAPGMGLIGFAEDRFPWPGQARHPQDQVHVEASHHHDHLPTSRVDPRGTRVTGKTVRAGSPQAPGHGEAKTHRSLGHLRYRLADGRERRIGQRGPGMSS